MVASPRLFEARHVFVELILAWKGGAIDTLQLLVILITAVIGTGNREQLKSLNLLGIADVGTRTQIDEFAVLVEADLFAFRHVVEAAEFVGRLADLVDLSDGVLT